MRSRPALAAALVLAACGGEGSDAVAEPRACGDCHDVGDPASPAGVALAGAHAAHLAPSANHAAIRCEACHPVPAAVEAPGHLDDAPPADVVFSGLAARRVEASFGPDGCVVYCHGAGLLVEQRRSPSWGSSATLGCDGCHGLPPPPPHPVASDCARCHLGVIDADGAIVSASRHLDTLLAAPTAAHFVHLGGGGRPPLACTACHDDDRYLLRDHRPLEETTVCDACHAPGRVDAAAWRSHPGLAGDLAR